MKSPTYNVKDVDQLSVEFVCNGTAMKLSPVDQEEAIYRMFNTRTPKDIARLVGLDVAGHTEDYPAYLVRKIYDTACRRREGEGWGETPWMGD